MISNLAVKRAADTLKLLTIEGVPNTVSNVHEVAAELTVILRAFAASANPLTATVREVAPVLVTATLPAEAPTFVPGWKRMNNLVEATVPLTGVYSIESTGEVNAESALNLYLELGLTTFNTPVKLVPETVIG